MNRSCGLDWIKDLLVSLDRPYAIVPVFNEIPIIYAPMYQFSTLYGFSIFHHELGHSVFKQFEGIGNNLNNVIIKHFEELKRSYERVKLTGAILGEGENAREAKRKLNELVREIDKCIALLNR